jgi:hypothetical protein
VGGGFLRLALVQNPWLRLWNWTWTKLNNNYVLNYKNKFKTSNKDKDLIFHFVFGWYLDFNIFKTA